MRRRRHEVHESRFAFHWSWRQHRGENILKKQLGRSCRNMLIYLHRWLGGSQRPILSSSPRGFLVLDIQGLVGFPSRGETSKPFHHFKKCLSRSFFWKYWSSMISPLKRRWECSGTRHLQPHTAPGNPVTQFIRKMGRTINTVEKYFFICSY